MWKDGFELVTPIGYWWAVPPAVKATTKTPKEPAQTKAPLQAEDMQQEARAKKVKKLKRVLKRPAAPPAVEPAQTKAPPQPEDMQQEARAKKVKKLRPAAAGPTTAAEKKRKSSEQLVSLRTLVKDTFGTDRRSPDGSKVQVLVETRADGWVLCIRRGKAQIFSWRQAAVYDTVGDDAELATRAVCAAATAAASEAATDSDKLWEMVMSQCS